MLRNGLESSNVKPAYFHMPQQIQHNPSRNLFIYRRHLQRE